VSGGRRGLAAALAVAFAGAAPGVAAQEPPAQPQVRELQRRTQENIRIPGQPRPDADAPPPATQLPVAAPRSEAEWGTVIDDAQRNPDRYGCAQIQNLWLLAEAQVRAGRPADAAATYARAIDGCDSAADRVATLQKASVLLSPAAADALFEREAPRPKSPAETARFETARYDFLKAWLSRQGRGRETADSRRLYDRLAAQATARRDGSAATQLGWAAFNRGRYQDAARWFRTALDWRAQASAAHGLALTRRRLGDDREAERLARQWQRGSPPMQGVLADVLADRAARAFDAGDYAGAFVALDERDRIAPPSRDSQLLRGWTLLRLGLPQEAADAFERLYRARQDDAAAEGVLVAAMATGDFARPAAIARSAGGPLAAFVDPASARPGAMAPRLRQVEEGYVSAWLDSPRADADPVLAARLENRLAPYAIQRRDGALGARLGWRHLDRGNLDAAGRWFVAAEQWGGGEEAAAGRARLALARGDTGDAERLARQWADTSPRMRQVMAEVLLRRAQEARDAGDPARSLELLAEHARYDPDSADAMLLRGWALYDTGRTADAASVFEEAYRKAPDERAADGVVVALSRQRRYERLAALAAAEGGPLADRWAAARPGLYADRKLFVAAHAADPAATPALRGIAGPSVTAGGTVRTRSGTSGLAQLDTYAAKAEARFASGRHMGFFRVDVLFLDAGSLDRGRPVGTAGTIERTGPVTRLDAGIEPTVGYAFQGWLTPYAELGATPLRGEVSPLPVGRLGLRQHYGTGRVGVEAFAAPRRDSLLSYTGIRDPYTGRAFGRVVEHGLRAGVYQEIDGPWSVSAEGAVSRLVGHEVADNERARAAVSLGYDLRLAGFDHFTVGPGYAYESYDRNLSHFTVGHGGYFSPRSMHRIGAGIDFLTREGAPWSIGGHLFAGWQRSSEDAAPFFPLADDGRRFDGGTNEGLGADGELRAVVRLAENWQLAAGFRFVKSPDFDELGGGVFLTWHPGGRTATVSTDFPDGAFQTAR